MHVGYSQLRSFFVNSAVQSVSRTYNRQTKSDGHHLLNVPNFKLNDVPFLKFGDFATTSVVNSGGLFEMSSFL